MKYQIGRLKAGVPGRMDGQGGCRNDLRWGISFFYSAETPVNGPTIVSTKKSTKTGKKAPHLHNPVIAKKFFFLF